MVRSSSWLARRHTLGRRASSRPDDRLHWLDRVNAHHNAPPPGSRSTQAFAARRLSHESTNRKRFLVRCLPARPASEFAVNGNGLPERSRRAAIARSVSSHGPWRKHDQSHATIRQPSNVARSQPSAPQKAHTVFLVSSTPPLRNDLNQMVLHRPVEIAPYCGNPIRRMTPHRSSAVGNVELHPNKFKILQGNGIHGLSKYRSQSFRHVRKKITPIGILATSDRLGQ